MQQHDIPELTPDEELDRTRVLPDPVDPLEGSARLPELRPEDEPVSVRTQDAEFAVTDHNPVVLEARLVS